MTQQGDPSGLPVVRPTAGRSVSGPAADCSAALDARVEPEAGGGWRITIPLRAERIRTERQTVVREEVVLRRRAVAGVERVEGTVGRERLSVGVRGDLEATQSIVDR